MTANSTLAVDMARGQTHTEPARWLRFLSRWAAVAGLAQLALMGVFVGGIGSPPSDTASGPEYVELMQAVRSPVLYRVAMLFDALGWALMGGILLALALLLWRRRPIRAAMIAACALGLVSGVLGGFTRLVGVSDLASRYISVPALQASLLQGYLVLQEVISACFAAGDLLAGAAYLLAAWCLFSFAGFPRWLALWLGAAGSMSLALFAIAAIGAFSFPFLLLTMLVLIGSNIALTLALWNPSASLISAIGDAGEAGMR